MTLKTTGKVWCQSVRSDKADVGQDVGVHEALSSSLANLQKLHDWRDEGDTIAVEEIVSTRQYTHAKLWSAVSHEKLHELRRWTQLPVDYDQSVIAKLVRPFDRALSEAELSLRNLFQFWVALIPDKVQFENDGLARIRLATNVEFDRACHYWKRRSIADAIEWRLCQPRESRMFSEKELAAYQHWIRRNNHQTIETNFSNGKSGC